MRDFGRQRRAHRRSQIQEYGSKTQDHGPITAKSENLPAAPGRRGQRRDEKRPSPASISLGRSLFGNQEEFWQAKINRIDCGSKATTRLARHAQHFS